MKIKSLLGSKAPERMEREELVRTVDRLEGEEHELDGAVLHNSFVSEYKEIDEATMTIQHFISTESTDRHGDIVRAKGMQDANFAKNPVVLYGHDYHSLPVGKSLWRKTARKGGVTGVLAATQFAPTEEGKLVFSLWKDGYLNAASIGFIPLAYDVIRGEEDDTGYKPILGFDITDWELLEYSIVPIPANQDALRNALLTKDELGSPEVRQRMYDAVTKAAIRYHKYPLADEGEKWNGPKEVAAADVSDLKKMCAWYDDSAAEDKGSYKLPHHRQSDKYTVWAGVRAAMGALLGARGGVNIPDGDKAGVHAHLAGHYKDFGKDAPPLKEYTQEELKGLFPEMYEEATTDPLLAGLTHIADTYATLAQKMEDLTKRFEQLNELILAVNDKVDQVQDSIDNEKQPTKADSESSKVESLGSEEVDGNDFIKQAVSGELSRMTGRITD